jgi:hypothetical protein
MKYTLRCVLENCLFSPSHISALAHNFLSIRLLDVFSFIYFVQKVNTRP